MQDIQKEKVEASKSYLLGNTIILLIELFLLTSVIPLQISEIVNDVYESPNGHGKVEYTDHYFNLWQKTDAFYMVLLNILFGAAIIINVICLLKLEKINKKIIFISHIFFVFSIISFFIVLYFANLNKQIG